MNKRDILKITMSEGACPTRKVQIPKYSDDPLALIWPHALWKLHKSIKLPKSKQCFAEKIALTLVAIG